MDYGMNDIKRKIAESDRATIQGMAKEKKIVLDGNSKLNAITGY